MSSVVFPVSFIACAIGPDLLSIAIAESTYPLARVFGARRISIGCSLLTLSIRIIWLVGDSFLELDSRKVSWICSFGLLDHRDLLSGLVSAPQGLQTHDCTHVRFKLVQGEALVCWRIRVAASRRLLLACCVLLSLYSRTVKMNKFSKMSLLKANPDPNPAPYQLSSLHQPSTWITYDVCSPIELVLARTLTIPIIELHFVHFEFVLVVASARATVYASHVFYLCLCLWLT